MASRRSLSEYDDNGAPDDPSEGFGGLFSPVTTSQGVGGFRTDIDGSDRPEGFFALSPEEQQRIRDEEAGYIAGDYMTGRELFGNRSQPPTQPSEPVSRVESPPNNGLPQGMTVQGEQGGSDFFGGQMEAQSNAIGYDGGQEAFSTPSQSIDPSPVASMRPNPEVTQRVTYGGSPSALFADDSSSPMFGRAGGLMAGGRGGIGGGQQGAPTPTEMMMALLRQFRNGV